jgi:hypothetical protein
LKHYLYACLFSNGIIKVGRSISPQTRISQHEIRLSVVGIDLIESHIVECLSDVLQAESGLIKKCDSIENSVKRANEWFENLVFIEVCNWIDKFCTEGFDEQFIEFCPPKQQRYDPLIDSKLRQEIATQMGLNDQYIYQCLTGRRNMKPIQASTIEKITNGAINRKMVCRTNWQAIWPELVEAQA